MKPSMPKPANLQYGQVDGELDMSDPGECELQYLFVSRLSSPTTHVPWGGGHECDMCCVLCVAGCVWMAYVWCAYRSCVVCVWCTCV